MSNSGKTKLTCPKCQASVRAAASLAGQRVRCPKCQSTIKVPGAAPSQSDDDDWLNLDEAAPKQSAKSPSTPTPPRKPVSDITSESSGVTEPSTPSPPFSSELEPSTASPFDAVPTSSNMDMDLGDLPDLSDADLDAMQFPLQDASAQFSVPTAPAAPFPVPTEPAPSVVSADVPTEYRFSCPICDSAHYASPEKSGREIKCVDCHSTIVVPAPPKTKAPQYSPSLENAPTFGLQESVERERVPESPFRKSAEDLLRDAEDTQMDEDLDELYENPDVAGWFAKVFGFFKEPQVLIHFFALAGIAGISCGVGLTIYDGTIATAAGATAVGLAGLTVILACAFAVLRATSNEESPIADWPYKSPAKWIGKTIIFLTATVLSALPGIALGVLVPPFWHILTLLSLFAFLPIVLFSMLENGSVFTPYSQEVANSLTRCKEEWGTFYFTSGLLYVMLFFIMLLFASGPISSRAMVYGIVTSAFILTQAKLLGRIAYEIGQGISLTQAIEPLPAQESIPQ